MDSPGENYAPPTALEKHEDDVDMTNLRERFARLHPRRQRAVQRMAAILISSYEEIEKELSAGRFKLGGCGLLLYSCVVALEPLSIVITDF